MKRLRSRPQPLPALLYACFSVLLALSLGSACELLDPTSLNRDKPTQGQVESELTCQCGCGLTVHSCNHLSCSSGEPLKEEIASQIATGKTLPSILSHFENKYGEVILSSPTKRGFNLVAWTIPFVLFGIGAGCVFLVLRRWRRESLGSEEEAASDSYDSVTTDPGLRSRLEEELEKFDREN